MNDQFEMKVHLKWLYAAFTGVCFVFFIALLGNEELLNKSILLQIATGCFVFVFPIFTIFTAVHIGLIEWQVPKEIYQPLLMEKRVKVITQFAIIIFLFGHIFILLHFFWPNYWYILLIFFSAMLYVALELRIFNKALHSALHLFAKSVRR